MSVDPANTEAARTTRIDKAVAHSRLWLAVAVSLHGDADRSPQELSERTRLFDVPGVCPPYEAAWIRRDKGAILADVAGFYRAFGFDAAQSEGIRPDHLGAMAEYLAVVCVMEARALEAGDSERAEVTHEAYVGFIRDHLVDWVASFLARLRESTLSPTMLDAAIRIEAAWKSTEEFGIPSLDSLDVAMVPDPVPGTPYACDQAGDGGGLVELTTSATG